MTTQNYKTTTKLPRHKDLSRETPFRLVGQVRYQPKLGLTLAYPVNAHDRYM